MQWRTITDAPGLVEWNTAWGSDAPFTPPLLASPDIAVLAAVDDGAQIGGAILNRGDGVVGVSNFFSRPPWNERVWRDLPAIAARQFAGERLVGYESGASLDDACAAGFAPLGELRVWHRRA